MFETDWMPCSTKVKTPDRPITVPEIDRKRGVLVVEDAIEIRDTLQAGLWHSGFNVWLAASGPEAVASYRNNGDSVDMVLLDVRMPDWDGPRTLLTLREVDARVRCCFMSDVTGDYSVPDLLRHGAIHVFLKPVFVRSVIEVMMALIPNDRATNLGEGLWNAEGGNGPGAGVAASRASDFAAAVVSKNSGIGD
jgi:DNA-binding response OmpR family regulator